MTQEKEKDAIIAHNMERLTKRMDVIIANDSEFYGLRGVTFEFRENEGTGDSLGDVYVDLSYIDLDELKETHPHLDDFEHCVVVLDIEEVAYRFDGETDYQMIDGRPFEED